MSWMSINSTSCEQQHIDYVSVPLGSGNAEWVSKAWKEKVTRNSTLPLPQGSLAHTSHILLHGLTLQSSVHILQRIYRFILMFIPATGHEKYSLGQREGKDQTWFLQWPTTSWGILWFLADNNVHLLSWVKFSLQPGFIATRHRRLEGRKGGIYGKYGFMVKVMGILATPWMLASSIHTVRSYDME